MLSRGVPLAVQAFFMVVLHTPLHPLLSSRWASLEFTGRRTGKIYHLPLAYFRDGDRVYITTGSRWWLNLQHGARVRILLRMRAYVGHASRITDPQQAAYHLRQILDAVPTLAYPGDIRLVDGRASDAELARAVGAGRKVIEIVLQS